MTLDTFRKKQGWSFAELARQTEAAHATVARRWCLPSSDPYSKIPAKRFMSKIIELSGGTVLPNDFYD